MPQYVLGLDIGIASIGWAVLRCDKDGEPAKIEDLGVRIFDKAEHPKNGASLALPRRLARSARRRIRRRRHRKERIKVMLVRSGIMTEEEMRQLFVVSSYEKDVYSLRAEGLDRKLDEREWTRVLIHLAQRRGFRSNSTAEAAKDSENGAMKAAIATNVRLMEEKSYRTAGEMFCLDEKFSVSNPDGTVWRKTRNTSGEYLFTITREMVEQEVAALFAAQRQFGNAFAKEELETEYASILLSQRNFDEGPGGDSPYKQQDLRGKCTFESDELRAFKACYTFEYFKLLQDINHIRILSKDAPERKLTAEERNTLVELAMASENLNYARVRKTLKLSDEQTFNVVRYNDKGVEESEKQTKFKEMQSFHKLKKALNGVRKGFVEELSTEKLDDVATILSLYKSDEKRKKALSELGLCEDAIDALLPLTFSKAGHLSLVAMKKMIPHLKTGVNYDVACAAVYGDHRGHLDTERSKLLSFNALRECGALDGITSPVVLRAISQTCKVINAIIRKYGSPTSIHIELAREMSHNFDERRKIEKQYLETRAKNQKLLEQIEEIKGARATGWDLVKFRLFREQNEICLYSGQKIDPALLFEPGYVDVGHIIPFSVSFDDSFNNKVLVLTAENRNKGNRLPLEYMAGDATKTERFKTLVETNIRSYRKKQNLLRESLSEDERHNLKERHLVDTRHISRAVYNILNDYLEFSDCGRKKKVLAINCAVTDFVLKRLGLRENREGGDLHYAMSAVVLATITDRMVARISNYSMRRERGYKVQGEYVDMETGEVMSKDAYDEKYAPSFPAPWPWFRKELEARLAPDPWSEIIAGKVPGYDSEETVRPVFVSRKPNRKVSGPAHKETIRSAKMPGYSVVKTPLTELKLTSDGEIKDYFDPSSDRLLYEALKEQLALFDGDGKKAFEKPFHKPKSDGTPGPLVRKVKTYSKTNLNVSVHGGIADNGSMVRIDVFRIEDEGYYFVPIYTSDVVKEELPNRAVVAHVPADAWKPMRDEDFLFSLYSGDLIMVEGRKEITVAAVSKDATGEPALHRKRWMLYYSSADIATGGIAGTTHDRKYMKRGMGIKTLCSLRKFEVDVLGEYHEVHVPEVRKKFH